MAEPVEFIAERRAVMTPGDVGALHTALVATSSRLSATGEHVEYLRSYYLSELCRWSGVFLAEDPQIVHRVTRIAQLSAVEVHRVLECVPPVMATTRSRVENKQYQEELILMNSVVMQGPSNVVSWGCVSESKGIERWVNDARDGRLDTSLVDLAGLEYGDAAMARRAVASLDPVDYVISVDTRRVDEHTRFEIEWAPTAGIVNLMLDWDLPILEITLEELSGWLDVEPGLVRRALARLAAYPGTDVSVVDPRGEVYVAIDIERCPLTAAHPVAAAS
ncbi:hypothetical protein K7711_41315 [Nocardia sp. CA2R105]|uniref:hypothetical protein n=1 Tax=Nocardia coffeae TaxID=2873381 RepID=UPI001CA771DC|nr:hypothetical protein [Nocardia coffeae]MBY8862970.1 hypothetical protein [Nocardia coffeae]